MYRSLIISYFLVGKILSKSVVQGAVKFKRANFSDVEDDPLGIAKLRSQFDVIISQRMEDFNLTGQVVITGVARGCVEVSYKVVLPGDSNPEDVQAFLKALTEDVAGIFERDPIFREYGAAPNGTPQMFSNVEAFFALNREPLELGGRHEFPSKATAAMRIIVLVVAYGIVGITVGRYLLLAIRILYPLVGKVPDLDMTKSASGVTEVLHLIVGILELQSQVRQYKKNCMRLINHLRLLEAIAKQLESMTLADPSCPIVGSFSKLQSALAEADALIARCVPMGKVSAFIHATSAKQEFADVSSTLSVSIAGLVPHQSASERRDIEDIIRRMSELAQDLASREYALELDERQAGRHTQMRETIDQMRSGTVELTVGQKAVHRLLEEAVGKAELQ
eukprot:evm.model.scf_830.2 EVM.evm.TU.scf_830.2   scf_830:44474-50423(+)